ncbi:hypothetical protein JOD55_000787 [Arcanobacterium pluranimalium]|uniref:DUF5692 family protein n=1 Tax=Arcanobacterium pluranimalium TaxID=108028 RepID=UPI001956F946|nr:DUF5692 family protein [Arcanobacterium pluranimalium]MBM7824960.1 hypothetical protein [Arcanobacterium pluranimalium]
MLFNVYGDAAAYQWLGWILVFCSLIGANEIARRSKAGGIFCFLVIPAALSIYFIAIYVGAAAGADWALNNPTYVHMNSWFHYAKLYAATAGCIGFMMLKYKWGSIGKSEWFKVFPFVIVAINILIAVVSDFESAIRAWNTTWVSSEGVTLYGGWHNVFNGLAGILNIFVMTGWFGIYVGKKKQDMIWADMTWVFIISYDLWNFCYTYNCLPTHAFYCGFALLLAPTVANAFWNKGGWIQNRANTLALWCMFAQTVPMFQDYSVFSVESVNNPNINLTVSLIAFIANVLAVGYVIYRARKLKVNPYKHEVFVGTRDFEQAMARRESAKRIAA